MSLIVKPLVWTQDRDFPHVWEATHLGEQRYKVLSYPDTSLLQRAGGSMGDQWSDMDYYPTLAAAQSAAQLEWDLFIRAAVEETP